MRLQCLAGEGIGTFLARARHRAPVSYTHLDVYKRQDFNPAICTPDRLAAWCSFWGEAQSRPIYQERCGANDEGYNRTLEGICARLMTEGGYSGDPVRVAPVSYTHLDVYKRQITTKHKDKIPSAPINAPEPLDISLSNLYLTTLEKDF